MFCRKCQPILSDWRLYKMQSYEMNYNHDSRSYNNSLLEINNILQCFGKDRQIYRTTSVRAPSSSSTPSRIVQTP